MYKYKWFESYEEFCDFLNNKKLKKENIIHIEVRRTNYKDWIDLVYKEDPAERETTLDYLQSVIDEINIWMGN